MACCRDWKYWIKSFFERLEIYEDTANGHSHKQDILISISDFLDDCCEEKAEQVYSNFFKAYWIGDKDNNPFLELVRKVSAYEQTAGSLIRNQRDHYCHAVNVFIIGIVIYQNSIKFEKHFNDFISKSDYKDAYSTNHEEFFYRWGLASLFHDVAYPIEITIKQLNEYYSYSVSYGNSDTEAKKEFLKVLGFEKYRQCSMLIVREEYREEFENKYDLGIYLTQTESCELLALDIASSLSLDLATLREHLMQYEDKISQGIIDHAYFGALICLKWHSVLFQASGWNPAYFFFPVLDASSSIFLHNAYEYLIMKDVNPGCKLKADEKPIAFLLILADTLQEWNRKGFGSETSNECPFCDVDFIFENDKMKINYTVASSHNKDIYRDLLKKLDFQGLFSEVKINYTQEQ